MVSQELWVIGPASSGEYGSSHVHSEYKADEKPCHENHIHRTRLDCWIKQITLHLMGKMEEKEINRATPGNGDWETRVSKRKENASLPACRYRWGREIESKREVEWNGKTTVVARGKVPGKAQEKGRGQAKQHSPTMENSVKRKKLLIV